LVFGPETGAKICVPDQVRVLCEDCGEKEGGGASISTEQIDSMRLLTLCAAPFERADWDQFLPPPPSGELRPEIVKQYLSRFNKPGGFTPREHLPLLLGALRSDLMTSNPDLIVGAMYGVFFASPILYEELLRRFPKLLSLVPRSPSTCATPREEYILLNEFEKDLRTYREPKNTRATLDAWRDIVLWTPLLRLLSPSTKASHIERLGLFLAEGAADTKEYSQLFVCLLYSLASNAVKPWFGEKPLEIVDVDYVREGDRVTPVVLANLPIDGDPATLTPYGFSLKRLPSLEIGAKKSAGTWLMHQEVTFTHGVRQYKTTIDMKQGREGAPVELREGPDYPALWKDGKLHGVVVVGSSLRDYATTTMDEYVSYYQRNGFEFSEGRVAVGSLPAFLEEQIKKGSADYLIKEAHSDGDRKNLFRVDARGAVLRGVRKDSRGKVIESVDLLFPESDRREGIETRLISNQDFGAWIRNRDTPLIYFNTSCWSINKALHELTAAQSPLLVDIPSTGVTRVFRDQDTSGEYAMLESLRLKRSYDEMRRALEGTANFKERGSDHFLFPSLSDKEYQARIVDVLKTPLDVRIETRDSAGKVVVLDHPVER